MCNMMIKSKILLLICFLSIAIANNPLKVDHKRLNDNFIKLSKISSVEFGRLSRVAYTDADIDGRKYVMQLMRAAGMDVYIDEGGNIIGTLKGKDNDLPPIAICLLYTSPSPRDGLLSRMPSSA